MGVTDNLRQHPRGAGRRLLAAATVCALILAVALTATACFGGGGNDTTTTSTAVTAGDTTTTGLPGSLDTVPSTDAAETTTSGASIAEDTTTTVAGTDGGTTTTEKLSTAEERLANGHIKAMGFIKKVTEQGGKRVITIDYAEMLGGQAAIDAAVAAGEISPGENVPNDYYMSNVNKTTRDFEVSASVAITTSTWQGKMENPVTWAVFKSFWSASPPDQEAALLRDSPWWIERDGQTVLKIDEQYLP
jgi:hypothetical protein